jgi:lincosamide nucleotidyltransferase A/C/D/E
VPTARARLRAHGFHILRDWLPTALALADDANREVDLHSVTPTADGGGDQAQLDGGWFHYPAPTAGVIAGRTVACVPAQTQIRCHLGCQPTDKDHHDMRLLAQRLGLALPPPYGPG